MNSSFNYLAGLACALFIGACNKNSNDNTNKFVADNSEQTIPDDNIQKIIRSDLEIYKVPGAVVGIFSPGKNPSIRTFGTIKTSDGTPINGSMLWPLRSITKSFTVTLILQLIDEGKLTLDSTVSEFISGVPNGEFITVKHLAEMSSGLADYTSQAFIDDFSKDPTRQFTLDELNAFATKQVTQFGPGTSYISTNSNTNILGKIVEVVTKQSFASALNDRIIKPLGLTNTKYVLKDSDWIDPHASGYQPVDGVLTEQPNNFSVFGPAGAMISDVYDMNIWAKVLATGQLLKAETQKKRVVGHKLEKGPEYDQYALGIGELNGWWGHTGEGFGFLALVMHNPTTGTSVVIFMNMSGVGEHIPTKLFRKLVSELS